MKNYLLTAFFAMILFGLKAQQQTIAPQPIENHYNYTISVVNIGNWSDDGSIKVVQTILRPLFEQAVPMDEATGAFKFSTWFPVDEEKVDLILFESGFELDEFTVSRKIEL